MLEGKTLFNDNNKNLQLLLYIYLVFPLFLSSFDFCISRFLLFAYKFKQCGIFVKIEPFINVKWLYLW